MGLTHADVAGDASKSLRREGAQRRIRLILPPYPN